MKKMFSVVRDDLPEGTVERFTKYFEFVATPENAEAVMVFGGDGAMLKAIRTLRFHAIPFFGFNFGHYGFLMNKATLRAAREIADGATKTVAIRMLHAELFDAQNRYIGDELAFNDFYFERASNQTAHMKVSVNGSIRFNPLICDGIIVCTPAGSTAYNASARGIIQPITAQCMILTGICPMLFHKWRSERLPVRSEVYLEATDTEKRPVRFLVDGIEIPGVEKASVEYCDISVELGFAQSQDFEEKVHALLSLAFRQ